MPSNQNIEQFESSLCIFGGTFDPVHNGHTNMAIQAIEHCKLSKIIFMPCSISPHKKNSTPPASNQHRYNMLKLATEDLTKNIDNTNCEVLISNWELRRQKPSYTWQTVEHFKISMPDAKLYWILGADQWNAIETWAKPSYLAKHLHFIVFPRENSTNSKPKKKFKTTFINFKYDCSATKIRHRVQNNILNKKFTKMLQPKVAEYIKSNKLYI